MAMRRRLIRGVALAFTLVLTASLQQAAGAAVPAGLVGGYLDGDLLVVNPEISVAAAADSTLTVTAIASYQGRCGTGCRLGMSVASVTPAPFVDLGPVGGTPATFTGVLPASAMGVLGPEADITFRVAPAGTTDGVAEVALGRLATTYLVQPPRAARYGTTVPVTIGGTATVTYLTPNGETGPMAGAVPTMPIPAGTAVRLSLRSSGRDFDLVASGSAGAAGTASLPWLASAGGVMRAEVGGVLSATATARVTYDRSQVRLGRTTASKVSTRVGEPLLIGATLKLISPSGYVAAPPGTPFAIGFSRDGRKWRTVRSAYSSKTGIAEAVVKPARTGYWRVWVFGATSKRVKVVARA